MSRYAELLSTILLWEIDLRSVKQKENQVGFASPSLLYQFEIFDNRYTTKLTYREQGILEYYETLIFRTNHTQSQHHYTTGMLMYGIGILVASWSLMIVGIVSLFSKPQVGSEEPYNLIGSYYINIILLSFVILWIWCVISWIGMKLFRHSKGGGTG